MGSTVEDDDSIRILMELVFTEKVTESVEIIAQNPSITTSLLTEDFIRSFKDVLRIRRSVVLYRCQTFFDTCYKKMLSSHKMYLTFVMFACISENKCNQNIFESFINVCALMLNLTAVTLEKTGVNFCHCFPVIFMIFYHLELKYIFCKRGGFRRLVEYIRSHRLVRGKYNQNNLLSPDSPTAAANDTERDLVEKLNKELSRDRVTEIVTHPDEASNDESSISLANLILSIPSIMKLPTLPSYNDLIMRLVASRKKEIAGKTEIQRRVEAAVTFETLNVGGLHGCSSSNTDSKTKYVTKHQENIARHENIIQAVIRHNHSKSSGHENANNRIQEEADEVLEHLKDTIKSLIEVLDEYDNE